MESESYNLCLTVCPIITQEPLDRFASSFDWGTLESHSNVINMVLPGMRKIDKIVIYDQVRVNGGSNY